jgi:chromosomal replication initiator protein
MHKSLWQTLLSSLSASVSPTEFETWLRPLIVTDQNDPNILIVSAPSQFICDFVEQNYKKFLLMHITKINPKIKTLSFVVADKKLYSENIVQIKQPRKKELPPRPSYSSGAVNKNFTFASFVVGSSNEFAKSAALAVAQAPGKTKFNPLLIYSGVGLGKTHLLHAIGNFLLSHTASPRIVYTSAEEFYLNFIDAIKSNTTKQFSDSYKMADILLIDDIQFLAGKESTQEEFFHIFNALYQNERQIVMTSDVAPVLLLGLQDRLISRFQWGLCVDIQVPDLETRIAILKKKAEEGKINISENILAYIAENVSSNIRELEGIIIRLLAFSSITKQDITDELVQNIILEKNKQKTARISIDEIINTVAEYYKVPVNNIREKNRHKEIVFCRQLAMYMAKLFTNFSLKSIGLHFGGRDHSTVIHAIKTVEKFEKKDSSISNDINHIYSILKNK